MALLVTQEQSKLGFHRRKTIGFDNQLTFGQNTLLAQNNFCIQKSLFQFIFSFAPYSNRIRPDAERVGHFLMQTEVWSIFILLGFQEIPFLFARNRNP